MKAHVNPDRLSTLYTTPRIHRLRLLSNRERRNNGPSEGTTTNPGFTRVFIDGRQSAHVLPGSRRRVN